MFNYKILFLLTLLASCSRSVDPLLPEPDASVNFYNASEVMASSQTLGTNNYVFVDDTVKKFASFASYLTDLRQYPNNNFNYGGYRMFSWMRMPAGTHRLQLTCHTKFPVADTSLFIPANTYQSVYLSESPEGDAVYRLLVVPEEHTGEPGKVRIRIVHLSADAGTLRCYRSLGEGQQTTTGLPQDISYGTATPYVTLDTTGTAQTRGNIILRLVDKNDPGNVVISTGVPGEPGSSFVLLLQGFRQATTRRLITGVKADGKFTDTTVTVPANLRVNVRRTY